jgi:cytosine/adenosine deaminase-related metal-dependent hydrolase
MATEPRILAADAILPMDDAYPQVLRNAGIIVADEKIVDIAELADLRRRHGLLQTERLQGLLLPGFVNAHTHLELSDRSAETLAEQAATQVWTSAILRTKTPPQKRTVDQRFARWIEVLMATRPSADQLETATRSAFHRGAEESLHAGVTTVGDISRYIAYTRSECATMAAGETAHAPRVVSFAEVLGIGNLRNVASALITAAAAGEDVLSPAGLPLLRRAISPHAPYTVEGPILRAVLRQAIGKTLPVTMHLAETAAEAPFLEDLSGPFGYEWQMMKDMNLLDDNIPRMRGGPIRWAQRWGLLISDAHTPPVRHFPVILAHVNICSDSELSQLAASRASVAYCPRTHAYFQHPPHRYRDMLDAGINVCLATDSRASNPDLSVLKEAQLLVQRDKLAPDTALKMITQRAAVALGLGDVLGSIAPAKAADFVLFPIDPKVVPTASNEDLFASVCAQNAPKLGVIMGGKRVI